MTRHEKFISRVYCLAREARAKGDHPFGALLVVDGTVALECLNTVNTSADVTRHPALCVSSREQWRYWLKENHAKAGEVWLVYYKKLGMK